MLHFDAGELPPVIVFWNMAMYASDMLFVENDFGRYSFGSTTDGLKKAGDGSLTISSSMISPVILLTGCRHQLGLSISL